MPESFTYTDVPVISPIFDGVKSPVISLARHPQSQTHWRAQSLYSQKQQRQSVESTPELRLATARQVWVRQSLWEEACEGGWIPTRTVLQGTRGALRGHSRAARSGGGGGQAQAATLSDTVPTRGTTLAPRLPQSPSFCKDIGQAFNASSLEDQNLTAPKWNSKAQISGFEKSVKKNIPKEVEGWNVAAPPTTKESCIIYKISTFLELFRELRSQDNQMAWIRRMDRLLQGKPGCKHFFLGQMPGLIQAGEKSSKNMMNRQKPGVG